MHILSEQSDVVCLGREGEVGEGVREAGDRRAHWFGKEKGDHHKETYYIIHSQGKVSETTKHVSIYVEPCWGHESSNLYFSYHFQLSVEHSNVDRHEYCRYILLLYYKGLLYQTSI